MAQLSYREAVSAAIAQEMRLDNSIVFIGEDIAKAGGVFKTCKSHGNILVFILEYSSGARVSNT